MNILTALIVFLSSFNHEPIKVGCGELTIMVEGKKRVLAYNEENFHLNIPQFTYKVTRNSVTFYNNHGEEKLILSPDYNLIVNK